jgi:hypothetical protein
MHGTSDGAFGEWNVYIAHLAWIVKGVDGCDLEHSLFLSTRKTSGVLAYAR